MRDRSSAISADRGLTGAGADEEAPGPAEAAGADEDASGPAWAGDRTPVLPIEEALALPMLSESGVPTLKCWGEACWMAGC